MNPLEKHFKIIEEATARLLARAENPRGCVMADLLPRVSAAVEKYVLRDDENASSVEIKEFIDALNADDLCLVLACEKADETAWGELVSKFDSTVKSAARKFASNTEDADDLASSIWAELYGLKHDKDGKLKTKLSYYSGRGSLAGWLRAVVSQLAVDQHRKDARFVQIEETREFENLANQSSGNSDNSKVVHTADNPEKLFSDKQTGLDVAKALKAAISRLEAEDRLILKLYYFDDLKLKDIGLTLGFHEATASRKIVRIQTEVKKSIEKILVSDFGWKTEEVKRNLSETASKLDLNLEKLFTVLLICGLMQEFWK